MEQSVNVLTTVSNRSVLERQVLGVEMVEVDLDRGVRDARQRQAIEVEVGVDGLDAPHVRRVMRQVAPGAEADLEDAAPRGREGPVARPAQLRARHRQVEHAREDVVVVEAQGRK